jgi:hypothetical protein
MPTGGIPRKTRSASHLFSKSELILLVKSDDPGELL